MWSLFSCPTTRSVRVPAPPLPFAPVFSAQFVVEELVNQTIVMALEAYGLVGAEGEGTEAKVLSDMEDMLKVRNSQGQSFNVLFCVMTT